MRRIVFGFDRGLALVEGVVLTGMLLSMIFLAFLQVILRNFFSSGIIWADELLRHEVLWVGLVGASLATREGRHINIDVVQRIASERVGKLIARGTSLLAGGVCLALFWVAVEFLKVEQETAGGSITLGVPIWWLEAIFPIAFVAMAFRFLVFAVYGEHSNGHRA